MLPSARICHSTARRLRVKIRSKKGDRAYFSRIREQLSGKPGVERLEANPVTGSVLLVHGLDQREIAQYAEGSGLFRIEGGPRTKPLSRQVMKSFGDMDGKVKAFTGGEMDLSEVTFLTLLGMGLYEIGRGNMMAPAWYTAFWYAFNIFLKARPE
jgi:hypothetical protein